MVAERTPDPGAAFDLFKRSFETFQGVLKVVSRETAPNDWAMICAEMGYTFVAALPIMGDDENKKTFARNALSLLRNARPILVSGGFQWDILRLDAAMKVAAAVTPPDPAPAGKN